MPTGRTAPRDRAVILDHIAARAAPASTARCGHALRLQRCAIGGSHNRFGVVSPFGGPTSSGMLTLHCPPAQLYALGSFLARSRRDTVSVASLDYVLDRENPLFARLEAFLRQ